METKAEYKVDKKKKDKPKYLGYIELENGSKLQIKEKALGKHLYRSVDKGYQGNTTGGLFSQLCELDGKPLSADDISNLESGLSIAIKNAVMDETYIKPIDIRQYPKKYQMVTNDHITKEVEIVEERKVKHDNEALKLAFNDTSRMGFWLLTMLIKVDGEYLNLEDVKKLPASEVEELIMLIPLKKYTFTPTM